MSLVDAFGWLGSAVLVFSLLQARMLRLRVINLLASIMLIVYNALVSTWPMVGMNGAVALIDLYFIAVIYRGYTADKRRSNASPEPTRGARS